ncbi:hypothetical protein DAI22_02g140200 [Oryza sativa Japonica Group]|nr:hypothetical protein DAI22_02g140200 [Oryza sativa Japonica Group]
MNPTESKKRRSKSNQAAGEPTALDPDAASVVGADGAPDATAVACGALRASAPGAGFPTAGAHAASPWWQESSPDSSEWMYPPGGFLNYLQNNKISPFSQTHPFVNYHNASKLPENFHFVGAPISYSTILSDARSEKRLNWSNEEDIRLASAWLHNSFNSIDGNDKKSNQYWLDVTATYNNTTKSNQRIKKPVSEFNGFYARITKIHQSGMSEDQKMDQAFQLYASEHNDKRFTMVHVGRILRHEKKWSTYLKKIKKEKDKSVTPNPTHVVNVKDAPKQRPIGHKKAKDECSGKRLTSDAISVIDHKLDKFIEASSNAEKMGEVQQSLANKKLEVANLNHKAAQEQTKGKMIDLYKDLLLAPTSDLSQEALAERSKALECMRLALFAKDN